MIQVTEVVMSTCEYMATTYKVGDRKHGPLTWITPTLTEMTEGVMERFGATMPPSNKPNG